MAGLGVGIGQGLAPSSGQPDSERPDQAAVPPSGGAGEGSDGWFGQGVMRRVKGLLLGQGKAQGQVQLGDAVGVVAGRDVDQDAGAGPGVLGGVVVVDQRHAGLLGGEGQGIGNQRIAAPGQHHGADVVVGRARQAGDFQAGPDDAKVKGGVVGCQDVAADEGADLREQLPEAGRPATSSARMPWIRTLW